MCIEGFDPEQIPKNLSSEKVLIPIAYAISKGYIASGHYKYQTRWSDGTVVIVSRRWKFIFAFVLLLLRRCFQEKTMIKEERLRNRSYAT